MTRLPFTQLDVFTARPLFGNPLAVVHGADGLDNATMARLAQWTNLSETAFLLEPTQPDADYRVRIFTPGAELPFAGHPTLGSAAAWLAHGGIPQRNDVVVQECAVGCVRIRRSEATSSTTRLAFAAPPVSFAAASAEDLARACAALGISGDLIRAAQWVDNGTRWLALLLADAASVLALEPDHAAIRRFAKLGLVGVHPSAFSPRDDARSDAADLEVRAFVAPVGIEEDPVTGSLNAMLAQWLIGSGVAPSHYVAAQGTRLGRAGRVYVEKRDDTLWIGGDVVGCITGELTL